MRYVLATALAAAVATGVAVAGLGTWSSGGPEGGPVEALLFDSAGTTLYAATRNNAVFRTTDGAASWAAAGDGLPATVRELAATAAGTLFARGDEGGLLRSSDGGASWQQALAGSITALAADPSSPDTAYAGSSLGLVFKTTDGGASWSSSGEGLPEARILRLAVDPMTPSILYLGAAEGGVYKSVDGGVGWAGANQGLGDTTTLSLVIDPQAPATLYLAASQGLFKSVDGGAAWTELNGPAGDAISRLAIDPGAPATLLGAAFGTVYRSTNGGAGWTEIGAGVPPVEVLAVAVDPASSTTYYAGTAAGVLETVDGGASWAAANAGLRAVRVDRLAVDPAAPTRLYAASSESGVFRSLDGGASWAAASAGLDDLRLADLALAPALPQTLYAAPARGIWRSQDSAATWAQPVTDPEEFSPLGPEVSSLAVDPLDEDTVLAFHGGPGGRDVPWGPGILRSVDGAVSWSRVFDPVELAAVRPGQLAVDPANPADVVAGLSAREEQGVVQVVLLLRSSDGGSTWTEALRRPGAGFVALDHDPLSPGTVYALADPGAGFAALRSGDGGDSWDDLPLSLPCVNDLLPDPETAGLLWAACDPVHRSDDGGATWAVFDTGGLPPAVEALTLARAVGAVTTLHAGTRVGVYSYDLPDVVDLAVGKDDGVTELDPGDALTYTIEVTNLGPADAVGATVTDDLPPELSCTWTCAGSGGGVCDPAPPAGDLDESVDLPVGAMVTFTASCLVDVGAGGPLANSVAAAPPVDAVDPVAANDVATDTDVVLETGPCGAFNDRHLSQLVLAGSEIIEACSSIRAGPAVEVASDVLFRAPAIALLELSVTSGSLALINAVPVP